MYVYIYIYIMGVFIFINRIYNSSQCDFVLSKINSYTFNY